MYLAIDDNDKHPIYLQIVNQIKQQIRNGTLKPGDELPSVRELAKLLGVNMHTVRSAYLKLREQGMINMRLGSRTTVAKSPRPVANYEVEADLQSRMKDLITDGLLSGLDLKDIHEIVDKEMKELNSESKRKGDL